VNSADGEEVGGQGVIDAADKADHVSATRPGRERAFFQ
jgi:hypothetical protein